MMSGTARILHAIAVAALLTGAMMPFAHADDDDDERMPTARNALWQTECGACHVAYPPRLLPAESWRTLMSGLERHFGSDASLPPAARQEIGAFLEKNAGSNRQAAGQPILRITETRWFKREHDEVPDRTWKNPKVKSPANCAACHTQAESGNYSEHGIRIPR